ncbi:MAG: hypothetical protein AAB897_04015 [Patescibacteria group bacterium]
MTADVFNKNSEPMSLDRLAQIIETTVAKKEDLAVLVTKEDLKILDQKVDAMEYTMKENFRLVREEVRSLNFAVEIDDLRERVRRLEQKTGLAQS